MFIGIEFSHISKLRGKWYYYHSYSAHTNKIEILLENIQKTIQPLENVVHFLKPQ